MKKSLVLAIILTLACSSVCFARVLKQYYPNGKLRAVQVYYDTGGIKGPNKNFWANGRLKQKTWYRHGLPYLTHTWSENGVRLQ